MKPLPTDRDLLLKISSDLSGMRSDINARMEDVERRLDVAEPQLTKVLRRQAYYTGAAGGIGGCLGLLAGIVF